MAESVAALAKRQRGRRGIQTDPDWRERFLVAYRELGAAWRAARVAGVHKRTVDRERQADPAFDDECRHAIEEHADTLTCELRDIGKRHNNPLPYFGILKTLRPAIWNERIVSVNLNVDTSVDATIDQAHALLAQALGLVTPATRAALASPPVALEHGPAPQQLTVGDGDGDVHQPPPSSQAPAESAGGGPDAAGA